MVRPKLHDLYSLFGGRGNGKCPPPPFFRDGQVFFFMLGRRGAANSGSSPASKFSGLLLWALLAETEHKGTCQISCLALEAAVRPRLRLTLANLTF